MTLIEKKLYVLLNLIDKFSNELFSITATGTERLEILKGDFNAWIDEVQNTFNEGFADLSKEEKNRVIELTQVLYGFAKMHPFMNKNLTGTSLNFDFTRIIKTLHYYSNYHKKKPRNRISDEEKEFMKLMPQIDLNQNPKQIQDKLDSLGLDLTEVTVRKYLKKYRKR